MNDAAAWFPESNTVLGAGGGQEVVHLAVDVLGAGQVLVALDLGLDQVVAVDGGGDSHLEIKKSSDQKHKLACNIIISEIGEVFNHCIIW